MRIAFGCADLRSLHAESRIALFKYAVGRNRFRKSRSTRAGVKFVGGTKKRIAGNDIDVNAGPLIVPILIAKGSLGSIFTRDMILVWFERRAQNGVARNRFQVIEGAGFLLLGLLVAVEKNCGDYRSRGKQPKPQRQV